MGGGPFYYDDSTRVNLEPFQHDVKVIWDQTPNALSIMDYLIGLESDLVVATGGAHSDDMEDMVCITLYFPQKRHARPYQRQLALPREGERHVGWRAAEDAGVE